MRIAIIGTGYVGLVTGVCLAEIGHEITCLDISKNKINKLNQGQSPIYEPGLEELIRKNMNAGRLSFKYMEEENFSGVKAIYIAVGTPPNQDGTVDLSFVEQAAISISRLVEENVIIVTKSTVPVGTNHWIAKKIKQLQTKSFKFDVVSNPEFLREGSAIYDTFHGDRIVIGTDNEAAAAVVEEINLPFGIPIFKTDTKSAEMIKYASNAFLATKISFINEISNLCEKLGANVEEVSHAMGMDQRIGSQFLKAGIGYGGSCFPKDTKALVQIAGNNQHEFDLLISVINVNTKQQKLLIEKAKTRYGDLKGRRIAILGLSFKPNTDDMREAASITVSKELLEEGASIIAYDPIANDMAKSILDPNVFYGHSIEDTVKDADCLFILTDWPEFKEMNLHHIFQLMKEPVVFDGRNCFPLDVMREYGFEYHSMGRSSILRKNIGEKNTVNY